VGRDAELTRLDAVFQTALEGRRRLVFVTGEAGIGKTALVEAFLARLDGGDGLRIGRGQCVEQYGAGEAYLPVLEALGRMGREQGGDALVRVLKQYAPTWLAELPALLTDQDLQAVQRRAQGTTRERMLRELIDAPMRWSAEAPLVLVLEGLHWSDRPPSSAGMLARRRDRARLLILAAYRPADVAATRTRSPVKQELQLHGLESWPRVPEQASVNDYLPGVSACDSRACFMNTNGNPLFP
jgi:predicted ATPase